MDDTRDISRATRAALVAALVFVTPSFAWAHAEEPNSQSVFAVDDGWVMRANVGIVQSSNPHELICEEAFLGGDNWILGVLGPTEWLTFGETTIMRTEDGCDFETITEIPRTPSDATVHPPSGGVAFLLNGVQGDSGLWVSTDRGRSFGQIQPFDPTTEQTTGVRYLDADTLFVSGYSRTDNGAGLAWTVDVATGALTPVEAPADVTYPYALAARGGYVLLLGRRGDQIVFWGPTDDLDANEYVASTWPSWARLSDDGQTAWIAGTLGGRGVARGAFVAPGAATWESLAEDTTAGCVEPIGDELLICGLGRFDDYDLLKITADGAVQGVIDFREFTGVRSDCPADTEVGTVCPLVWNELAPYFGIDPAVQPDAGGETADVGSEPGGADMASAPATPQPGEGETSGCCATAASGGAGSGWLVLLAAIGWRRRRALTQNSRRC